MLHHGAPEGNELWEYDGWGPGYAHGGIYHEHAPDTTWVRHLLLFLACLGSYDHYTLIACLLNRFAELSEQLVSIIAMFDSWLLVQKLFNLN